MSDFAGGSGTRDDPYQIETWTHLSNIKNEDGDGNKKYYEDYFILNNDLDEDTAGYDDNVGSNTTDGWIPVGDSSDYFLGSFDGDGHTISDLIIDRGSEDEVGLFGFVGRKGGETDDNGDEFSRYMHKVIFENADVKGNERVGIFIGYIQLRAYDGETLDNRPGHNIQQVEIYDSTVEGYERVGGVVGYGTAEHNTNKFIQCHSEANVTVDTEDGGMIAGFLSNYESIGYLTAEGDIINPSADKIGGLIGLTPNDIENSHHIGKVEGNSYVGGIKGMWEDTYNDKPAGAILYCYQEGDVTSCSHHVGGLAGMSDRVSYSYMVEGDVEGRRPAGGLVGEGQGATESYFEGNVTDNGGGSMWNAVGGLIGRNNGGYVVRCYVKGTVDAQDIDRVGGLVGHNDFGNIKNSYMRGDVKGGSEYIGGIVGWANGITLENCYSTGDITGTGTKGGVAGHFDNGDMYDSMCIYDTVIGESYQSTKHGRVTSAPEEDLKNIEMYIEDGFKDYDDLNEAWDITEVGEESNDNYTWNMVTNPKPRLWEKYEEGGWEAINESEWSVEKGIGRNLLIPIAKLNIDIKDERKLDSNQLVRLGLTESGGSYPFLSYEEGNDYVDIAEEVIRGRTKSGGKIKSDGKVEYDILGNGWEIMDKLVNIQKGEGNYSLLFNGSDEYVEFYDESDNYDFEFLDSTMTTTFWFKTENRPDEGDPIDGIVTHMDSGGDESYIAGIDENGHIVGRFVDINDDENEDSIEEKEYDDGDWHFVGMGVDVNGDIMRLKVDGDYNLSYYGGDDLREKGRLVLASSNIAWYNGEIDDVRIWTGKILTQSEMEQVREARNDYSAWGDEDGWWTLNDGTGTTVTSEDSATHNDFDGDMINFDDPDESWIILEMSTQDILAGALAGTDYEVNATGVTEEVTLTSFETENVKVKDVMRDIFDRALEVVRVDTLNKVFYLEDENARGEFGTGYETSTDKMRINNFEEGSVETIINEVIIYTPFAPSDYAEASSSDSISEYGERSKIYNLEYITTDEEGQAMADAILGVKKDPQPQAEILLGGDLKTYEDITNRNITISSDPLRIDETTLLIEKQIMSEGLTELRAGRGSSWGIEEDNREKRSNRWK